MIGYYDANAATFIAGTLDVDMSGVRERFLAALPPAAAGPARILDAGSGSGRDALAFRLAGHAVEAFDASPAMVAATRSHSAVPTRQMRFEDFAWEHSFEGIWACASLLHVAPADLSRVICRLSTHLATGGILYMSFKQGEGVRIKDGRRFTDMTPDQLKGLLDHCPGLGQPDIWLSGDQRPHRMSEIWVNALVKRA